MITVVKTQAELDKAIKAGKTDISIEAPDGATLVLTSPASTRVVAWGSSRVEARESSSVEARESSRVVAWESSRVEARGSSRVEAWGSSRVVASRFVSVHLWDARVKLTGNGHLIDMTKLDLSKAEDWVDYRGVKVTRGKVIVYKAVDAQLNAGHRHTLTAYPIGKKVTAPDFDPQPYCGQGLHFAPSPAAASRYFTGVGEARFLAVQIDLKDLIPLDDKCKAPSGKVMYEVDIHGDAVAVPAVKA